MRIGGTAGVDAAGPCARKGARDPATVASSATAAVTRDTDRRTREVNTFELDARIASVLREADLVSGGVVSVITSDLTSLTAKRLLRPECTPGPMIFCC